MKIQLQTLWFNKKKLAFFLDNSRAHIEMSARTILGCKIVRKLTRTHQKEVVTNVIINCLKMYKFQVLSELFNTPVSNAMYSSFHAMSKFSVYVRTYVAKRIKCFQKQFSDKHTKRRHFKSTLKEKNTLLVTNNRRKQI